MGLLTALSAAGREFRNQLRNREHSGVTPFGTGDNGRTTSVSFLPLKSLREMTPPDRQESIKVSRFICNRLGLGRGLTEGCTRYAVGGGIIGYAATGDQQYDDEANRFCDSIFEEPTFDVTRESSFYDLQEIVCPTMMTDGDLGAGKVLERDDMGHVIHGPQIQLFTQEQIVNRGVPGIGELWKEGILYNDVQRKLKFRVEEEAMPGRYGVLRFDDWDAEDFLHIYDRKRVNQGRGMPWLHHGGNSCISMIDLVELEKAAAYLNSYFSAVITTPEGEVPEMLEEQIFTKRASMMSETPSGDKVEKESMRKYVDFLGGAGIPILKAGEKLEIVKNERPSLTFTGFLDWLVNDIAWGFGVPPQFVWTLAGMTGPNARLILSQADHFFRFIIRRMVSRFCKPTRDWVLRYGLVTGQINNGRLPRNGADYRLCRWHGPRKITIDEGREGKLAMERIMNGFGTEEEYHGERGMDGDVVARKRIQEIKRRMDWCKEHGVPIELYFGSLAKPGLVLTDPDDTDAAKSDEQDEQEARKAA